jgi:hypothetical protein
MGINIEEIFRTNYDYKYEYARYISDSPELVKILKSDKSSNIIAPMNSGKTYGIIEHV